MSKTFSADTKELKHLLSSIQNKERALPDFQRDFVWDAYAIQELLHSVLKNYPAGSLLEIQQKENFFRPRHFAEAPEISFEMIPPYLVLDGQQRLTSLYQALYGKGKHRFYLNIGILKNFALSVNAEDSLHESLDIEEALFHETLRSYKGKLNEKDSWPIERQAKELVLPLATVLGKPGGYEAWRDEVVEKRKESSLYEAGDNEILRRFGKELVDNLSNYHFPLVTLQSSTPKEAVCTIFETLNRTGVKLSVFDLLVARLYADDIKMRDDWEEAKQEHPLLMEFSVDPYYILQTIALRCERKGMGECKRSTVLKLEPGDYRKYWQSSVEGLASGLQILREECGVLNSSWLPYSTYLVPLAAIIADSKSQVRGVDTAAWKDKLHRWFWSSIVCQSYENAPNSMSKTHYIDMLRWLKDEKEPAFLSEASKIYESLNLLEITPKQRARYRGFMCAILRRGIRDFYKAEPITPGKLANGEVNDHHIFPKAVFGNGEWAETIDSIPNRTLIDELSNKIIRDKRPSVYIPQLQQKCRPEFLAETFKNHLMPIEEGSSLWDDDLASFVNERAKILKQELGNLLGIPPNELVKQ